MRKFLRFAIVAAFMLSAKPAFAQTVHSPTLERNNTWLGTQQFNGAVSMPGGLTLGGNLGVGSLSATGNGTIGGTFGVTGTSTFGAAFLKSANGLRFADQFSGADIGAKINAAFTDCSNQCTVYVPAGTYNSVTTTVNFPLTTNGTAAIWLDPGAVVNYTGSGDAIAALGSGNSQVNFRVYGTGVINGTSSGASGIHIKAFSRAYIEGVRINGFTNGDAIKNEGANTVEITNCSANNSKNGIHNVAVTGPFAPNAVHVSGCLIANNSNAGIYDDATGIANGANGGNVYDHNTLEDNGTTGSSTTAVWLAKSCVNCAFTNNYVENGTNKPLSGILMGDTGALSFNTANNIIQNNAFALAGSTQSILIQNGIQHIIQFNNEGATGQTNFLKSTGNANQLFVGLNSAGNLANSAVYSTVGANDVVYSFGSTQLNAWYGLIGGVGFNSVSGLNQDLAIRERQSSSGNIVNYVAAGGSTVASVSNTGGFSGTTVAATTSATIGSGTPITKIVVYSVSYTPTAVSANSTSEQSVTATGVSTADVVSFNPPATAVSCVPAYARPTTNAVILAFVNPTGSSCTPTSGTFTFIAFRH